MTKEIEIKIHDYDESMAKDVAAMWNTWDDLWPGGFTQGVPYTEDRVKKQYGKSDALAILIAIDPESSKPMECLLKHLGRRLARNSFSNRYRGHWRKGIPVLISIRGLEI